MTSMRRRVLDAIPIGLRMRARLVAHNARARRSADGSIVALHVTHHDDRWSVDDGTTRLYVPSIRRWLRYANGVDHGIARVAGVYRIGHEVTISPGDVVLDVGANIGEVTIACARAGAVVHAFEAEPHTATLLETNVGRLPGVHLHNEAVSDHTGTVTFFIDPDDADSSTIEPYDGAPSLTVACTTLDTFAQGHGIDTVHLLKCDAEGAEPEVLAGATELLARTTWVAIDCGAERHGATTVDPVRATLDAHGFDVTVHPVTDVRVILLGHRRSA